MLIGDSGKKLKLRGRKGEQMKTIKTRTGKIYCDTKKRLEFLSVGDYGKSNNIKASFLGLEKPIHGVTHREVDLSEKWVATISTQKGCPMRCAFCDVPAYGFYGNCSISDLEYQVKHIIINEDVKHTKRFNLHYARMGEPTYNEDVLRFTSDYLDKIVNKYILADTIHPVISTMLPKHTLVDSFIMSWCNIKNTRRSGEAGLQFSINSTDEEQRNRQFNKASHSLSKISDIADKMPYPIGRKYTLNFAVTEDTILDAKKLTSMFDKEKFIVKITPIHKTSSADKNGFNVSTTYQSYDVYQKFEEPLLEEGWDVIVFVPSKEEDEDRITCGNAILSQIGL